MYAVIMHFILESLFTSFQEAIITTTADYIFIMFITCFCDYHKETKSVVSIYYPSYLAGLYYSLHLFPLSLFIVNAETTGSVPQIYLNNTTCNTTCIQE